MRQLLVAGVGVLAIAGLTACGSESSGENTAGGVVDAHYKPPTVANGCDLLDLTALDPWEATAGKREHTKDENILGTVLTCDAENKGADRLAAFQLETTVHKNRGEARSGYERGRRFAKNASDVTSSGAVAGLGSEAFFVWTKHDYSATAALNTASTYQILVLDGSLQVSLFFGVAAPVTEAEAAGVAQQQAQRVLTKLKG